MPKPLLLPLAALIVLPLLLASADAREVETFSPNLRVSLESDFLWRSVRDVQYQNGLIYLLMVNGLQIYDGGVDFIAPQLVSQLSLDYPYVNMIVGGNNADLLTRDGLLTIADISHSDMPLKLGSVRLADTVFDYVSSEVAGYAACGFEGIYVVNRSDPSDLDISAMLTEGVHLTSVALVGDFLYAGDDYNGILIYSLEDPLKPYLFDVIFYPKPVRDIAFDDERFYIAYGDSGVISYDVGLPGQLLRGREYRTESAAIGVSVVGNLLFADDLMGDFYVFNLESDEPRFVVDDRDVPGRFDFRRRNDRDYLFLTDKIGGFDIISIDEGAEPNQVWQYPGADLISSVALIDSFAAIAGADDDLSIWRAGTGTYPQFFTFVNSSTRYSFVTGLGSVLFVAENSLPANSFIHLVYSDEPCCEFGIRKSLLAVSDILDIKAEPGDSGTIELTAFGPSGVTVITLGLPGDPPADNYFVIEATFSPSRTPLTAGERHDGYLYTASTKGGGGQIFDVTSPSSHLEPPLVGSFDVDGRAYCIEVVDSICYVGSSRGLDIRSMSGFLVGARLEMVFPEYDVFDLEFDWDDSLMFAALGEDGVGVFDVSDIGAPDILTRLSTPGFAEVIDVSGGRLVVSDRYSVLVFDYILDKSSNQPILPSNYALSQNYPNPFNNVTHIEFSIGGDAASRPVELRIFNALGQAVTTLVEGDLQPGVHHFTWNGRDSYGEEVATGVYFYRLTVDDARSAKKMVLLK
ncbi:MAG: T9SS type A sorting domain-containing protein [candidate division Zixibacteria bacterium]|nr:T9SS type A sorting domain-containing protein [candidate division Zixibacteria bacterium]